MANYNLTRYVEDLLKTTHSSPPSFTVHLKNAHWCLNNYNAGAKFAYNHQVASLLDDIRAQRIPVDLLELFDTENVPFYEGCLLVEIRDYRPRDSIDDFISSRVILQPNSETMWADICQLSNKAGSKWSDQEALKVEARILMATAPALCLDPDPHLVRAANNTLRVSVPTAPASLKRKASAMDPEETAHEKVRRAKIMQFMRPANSKMHNWKVLEALERQKRGVTAPTPVRPTSASSTQHSVPQAGSTSSTPVPPSVVPAFGEQNSQASPVNGRDPTPVPQARNGANSYSQSSPALSSTSPSKSIPITRQPSTDPHKQLNSPQLQTQLTQANTQSTQPAQQVHPSQYALAFQPPPANFLMQPQFPKKKGQQTQLPSATAQAQIQMFAFQQQYNYQTQQAAAAAQRYSQSVQQPQAAASSGTNPAAGTRSPMMQNGQLAQNPNRPSPLAANQPQSSRSPMPSSSGTPQPQHPQQLTPQQQQQHAYNLALHQQNQYHVARAQAIQAGQPPPPMPPLLAAHLQHQAQAAHAQHQPGNAPPSTQSQDGVQMMPGYTAMFNYAQMQPARGMPQGYPWPATMGYGGRRGMPANGQPQAPAAANGNQQQMAVGRQGVPGR